MSMELVCKDDRKSVYLTSDDPTIRHLDTDVPCDSDDFMLDIPDADTFEYTADEIVTAAKLAPMLKAIAQMEADLNADTADTTDDED